jgi:hypothetical protein
MSENYQINTGDKRNAPMWQVFGVILVLMCFSAASFYFGSKNPAPDANANYNYQSSGEFFDESSSGESSSGGSYSGSSDTTQYLTLNNLIGYGSNSVEQALRSSGLYVQTQYTTFDPSISARINNGCPVVDQNPGPGSVIPVGSTVIILADCPMTGSW